MNELKKYLWQKKMMKIKYILICILGFDRVKYLKQHNVFAELGDNVLYQPIKLPNEPKLIKIHNNVKVAADVTFYTHDVINSVFAIKFGGRYQTHGSCIEIYDNVFIGGNSIIVGNVPEGAIVAGNPAKIVDSFSNLYEKRYNLEEGTSGWDPNLRDTELWEQFYYDKSERNKKKRK